MKKQKKGLLVVVILLIVLIGAFFGIRKWGEVRDERESSENVTYELTALDPASVTAFTIKNSKGIWSFTRTGDEETPWKGGDLAAEIETLDQDEVAEVLDSACHMEADYRMDDHEALDEYGLQDPPMTVSFTLQDGTATQLNIGDENNAIHRFYANVNGDDSVYCIQNFTKIKLDLTESQITKSEESGESGDTAEEPAT
ncbi:MAG: DUF4340 domain-containing protein [Lachnospiraceae bacterium]|nr:DUF4340 domain-containing protein [Lachnospiraceae bacterium]